VKGVKNVVCALAHYYIFQLNLLLYRLHKFKDANVNESYLRLSEITTEFQ